MTYRAQPALDLPRIEVRRCPACRCATAVCVRDWQHAISGMPQAGGPREMCCQSCGAVFTVHPTVTIVLAFVAAGIVSIAGVACGLGVVLPAVVALAPAAFAIRALTRDAPVVEDAPMPAIVLEPWDVFEAPRRCTTCGASARCVNMTTFRVNGISGGVELAYACACGRTFTIQSAWRTICLSAGSVLCGAFAAAFLGDAPPDAARATWRIDALLLGTVFGLVAVAVLALIAIEVVARVRSPRVAIARRG